jgi:WD40 repeat protein
LVTAAFDVRQSATADHSARIWTAPLLGQLSTRRPSETNRVFHVAAFGAEQQVFASAYADATVELRQSNDAEPTLFKALADERWGFVSAAVPSPDGQRIAIASFGAGVASGKHDTTAKWVRAVQIFQASAPDKPLQTREVPAVAKFVAWNEKGDRIVAALEDATAMVFAASNNAPPVVFKGHTKWLTSAAFSIDGTKLVTTSLDKTALVFDSRGNGPPIARFEHPGAVYSATFDPTGQRVATACIDGKVRIFDIGGGAPTELDAKGIPLYRIAWSADGSRLAAATSTSTILAWSHLSWPLAAELRPSVLQTETPAVALAFSKGSDKLMAAATDRIYSWNLDVVGLQFALREENRDCLPVNDRALYLNEPVDVAIKAFQDCQTAQHRGSPAESPKTVVREDLVVARLFVVPVDAEVEWDGTRATPRDGLFELWGKAGEKKKIRVVKGAWSTETEVLIENSGATPPVIDLEAISGSNGDVKKAAKQLGEGDFDSLVPVEFQ